MNEPVTMADVLSMGAMLEARINELTTRVVDLEAEREAYVRWQSEMAMLQRGQRDLAARVTSLVGRMVDVEDRLASHLEGVHEEPDGEGVITLRITAERGR